MLLSRFWYIFLAIAVGAATGAALLAQTAINARSEDALTQTLQHDRSMVDALLRLEARARLDRIAFITVDAKLGGLLKQAAGVVDARKLEDIQAAVKGVMHSHIGKIAEAEGAEPAAAEQRRQVEPDIAFALDSDGRIIAQLGPTEQNPPGASLATFPLVRRALQGYVRDDVWVYDRRVYRMAARPVVSAGEYAGAILHGYRLEKGLPDKLSASLGGATLAFFHDNAILGSHVPAGSSNAPQAAELASVLPGVFKDPKFQAGQRAPAITLPSGGRALFDRITGSARALGVGYAVARPLQPLTSPWQLFQQASEDDIKALPLLWLGLGAALIAALGLLWIYLERDRHMRTLAVKTGEIGSGARDRLIVTEWRGEYRALADRINQALEKTAERAGERAPPARKKANLDDILGPTPESSVTPFFAFATDEPLRGDVPAAGAAKPAARAPAQSAKNQPAPARAGGSGSGPLPIATAAAVSTDSASTGSQSAVAAPPSPPARSLGQPPVRPPAPTAAAAKPEIKPEAGDGNPDDAHWREVYEAYIATRKQCGEPVDNLNFEKFGLTLRKTRDQIVDKQGVKTVRFSVQVKEGKAALKAQPIKR
jgi:hypothetical protein